MIYLDYNATTPLCEPARAAMLPYLERHFGNASSIHSAGREARAAIDDARDQLAGLLNVKPHELIFTGSGTESNNLAVLGLARSRRDVGRHLICSSVEHHAVLHAFEHLQEREGFEVTFLRVDSDGRVDPGDVANSLRSDTTLVSVMSANNETGVLQPMHKIAEICRANGVLLHSDMVQAFGKISVIPSEVEGPRSSTLPPARRGPSTSLRSAQDDVVSCVDAASFSAHKFYGPKGAGLLYLRSGIAIESIQFGGAHENQRRPGTENVAAIAGMAAAAEWVLKDVTAEQEREAALRDQLWRMIEAVCPSAQQNGAGAARLGNTLNVSFQGLESETLLMALDLEGVCVSSGSACMVGSVVSSHVQLAMGGAAEAGRSAVRFSVGKQTTEEEIAAAGNAVARVLQR
ncbi:MAG: cysteine desulfurase, partial [Verrucomicrobiota bacterium]|nr:cysteine desulfurase [Verrucomicrobiota bacterium]